MSATTLPGQQSLTFVRAAVKRPGDFAFRGFVARADGEGSDVVELADRAAYVAFMAGLPAPTSRHTGDDFPRWYKATLKAAVADLKSRKATRTRKPAVKVLGQSAPKAPAGDVAVWDPRPLAPGAWVTFWVDGEERTGQVSDESSTGGYWVIPADRRAGDPAAFDVSRPAHIGFNVPEGLFGEDECGTAVPEPAEVTSATPDRTFTTVAQLRAHWRAGADGTLPDGSVVAVKAAAALPDREHVLSALGGLVASKTQGGYVIRHAGSGKLVGRTVRTRAAAVVAMAELESLGIVWGGHESGIITAGMGRIVGMITDGTATPEDIAEVAAKVAEAAAKVEDSAPVEIPAPVAQAEESDRPAHVDTCGCGDVCTTPTPGRAPVVAQVDALATAAPMVEDPSATDTSVIPDGADPFDNDTIGAAVQSFRAADRDRELSMSRAPRHWTIRPEMLRALSGGSYGIGGGIVRDAVAYWTISQAAVALAGELQAGHLEAWPMCQTLIDAFDRLARDAWDMATRLKATARTQGFPMRDHVPSAADLATAPAPTADTAVTGVPAPMTVLACGHSTDDVLMRTSRTTCWHDHPSRGGGPVQTYPVVLVGEIQASVEPVTQATPVEAASGPQGAAPVATVTTDVQGFTTILVRDDVAAVLLGAQSQDWTEYAGCGAGYSGTFQRGTPVAVAVEAVLGALAEHVRRHGPIRGIGVCLSDAGRPAAGWSGVRVAPVGAWDERGWWRQGIPDGARPMIRSVGWTNGWPADGVPAGWEFYG